MRISYKTQSQGDLQSKRILEIQKGIRWMGESKRIIEKKSENDDDRHSSRKNVHVDSKNDEFSKIRK